MAPEKVNRCVDCAVQCLSAYLCIVWIMFWLYFTLYVSRSWWLMQPSGDYGVCLEDVSFTVFCHCYRRVFSVFIYVDDVHIDSFWNLWNGQERIGVTEEKKHHILRKFPPQCRLWIHRRNSRNSGWHRQRQVVLQMIYKFVTWNQCINLNMPVMSPDSLICCHIYLFIHSFIYCRIRCIAYEQFIN